MTRSEIIEEHYQSLWQYANYQCCKRGLPDLTEEVLHECVIVFLELTEKKYNAIENKPAWLRALIRRSIWLPNTSFHREFIDNPFTRQIIDDYDQQVEEYTKSVETYRHVCQILEVMFPYNERQLFYFALKRGWNIKEISEYCEIPYHVVREKINDTKDKLKKIITFA